MMSARSACNTNIFEMMNIYDALSPSSVMVTNNENEKLAMKIGKETNGREQYSCIETNRRTKQFLV